MIFRAAFFIGLVAMLMPHEPDIGLGRPGAVIGLPSPASVLSAVGLPRMEQVCGFCAGPGAFTGAPALGSGRNLSDVKTEIEAAIKARRAASVR